MLLHWSDGIAGIHCIRLLSRSLFAVQQRKYVASGLSTSDGLGVLNANHSEKED